MGSQITIKRIESVPEDVDVSHFDELPELAKDYFASFVQDGVEISGETEIIDELAQYDIVKYTEYYEICLSIS
ncbi:hypothetical protein [Haladaptatus halobius]|uniref:hypothetical protein n=1 Tax=Haladaptatus halobius TaxID=2884875 RepID=UPI001D0B1C25|nr:hypothetical protein [Haladaptatus halobius]